MEDKQINPQSDSDMPSDQPCGFSVTEKNLLTDEILTQTHEEKHTVSIADAILEGLSAETNVSRLTKLTKLPKHIVTYFIAVIYLVVGVLCVAITNEITEVLPYIVGGMMIIIGTSRFIVALVKREYRHTKTNITAMSLVIAALGVMITIQQLDPENQAAIAFISIVWGILGLMEGAQALNHAFKRISNSERCIYFLLRGVVELVVAFMLLYDPGNHATHHFHIIVFGLNLILDGITMVPQVKAFLSTK